jgi:hypothetical protein
MRLKKRSSRRLRKASIATRLRKPLSSQCLDRCPGRSADVERTGIQPVDISRADSSFIKSAVFDQLPREGESKFAVVGWLSRDQIPGPAIFEPRYTIGKILGNPDGRGELDRGSEGIASQLTEQTPLGAGQQVGLWFDN